MYSPRQLNSTPFKREGAPYQGQWVLRKSSKPLHWYFYTDTHMCAHTHNAESTALYRQKLSGHSNNIHQPAFFIHPSSFIVLMSIKQAYNSFMITSSSLHLSLLMPAFKLGACRWLLIMISTLTSASKVSVNAETSFWQTLHQNREEGTDPNIKSWNEWLVARVTEKQKICPMPCRAHQKTDHAPPYCFYGLSTIKKILP